MGSSIAQLNNAAVAKLAEGNHNEAIKLIKICLINLKANLDVKADNNSEKRGIDIGIGDFRSPLIQSVPVCDQMTSNSLSARSSDNLFSFFTGAFVFENALEIHQQSPHLIIVLLYNFALSFHLLALQLQLQHQHEGKRDKDSQCYLTQAKNMYQSALDMICREREEEDLEQLTSILMATTNNLGHVHSHFLNFAETRECVQLMSYLMAHPTLADELSDEDLDIFNGSLSSFVSDLTIAPAA
mgnify:CR=1 FL=1